MVTLLSKLFCFNAIVLCSYRVVNIFLNGTHVRSRVNLVHFKPVQLEPYETHMMKLTCCTWDCLLEHEAHIRHITQIGTYFILRNNWHIDVPWKISKIFYWTSFFFCSTHGFDIELYGILYGILCKLYILRIGVLDWHIHCAGVWYEIIEIVQHTLDIHLGTRKRFDEVENVSGKFLFLPIQYFVLKFWNLHYFHLFERFIYLFIF